MTSICIQKFQKWTKNFAWIILFEIMSSLVRVLRYGTHRFNIRHFLIHKKHRNNSCLLCILKMPFYLKDIFLNFLFFECCTQNFPMHKYHVDSHKKYLSTKKIQFWGDLTWELHKRSFKYVNNLCVCVCVSLCMFSLKLALSLFLFVRCYYYFMAITLKHNTYTKTR